MNGSGLLWSDGLAVSVLLYVWGGWAATVAGWATCLFTGIAQGRWRVAGGCALLGLLPALYLFALFLLAVGFVGPAHSDFTLLLLLGGMVLATLACPVAAGILAWRGPPRRDSSRA